MSPSAVFLDHCRHPRNVGAFPDADPLVGIGVATSAACGDTVRFQVRIREGSDIIDEARFKAYGCSAVIASASFVTRWLEGRTLDDAGSIRSADIAGELGLTDETTHAADLLVEAVGAALVSLDARRTPARRAP